MLSYVVMVPDAGRGVLKPGTVWAAPEPGEQKPAAETRESLRRKAISQYRSVIEAYPGTKAAAVAAERLRELGADAEAPSPSAPAVPSPLPAAAPVPAAAAKPVSGSVQLDVAQLAAVELALTPPSKGAEAGRTVGIPFTVINLGNGIDSFQLASDFPTAFSPVFTAAATPAAALSQTPPINPGETFSGLLTVTVPAAIADGMRITNTVSAVSHLSAEVRRTRELHLTASAPRLTALVVPDAARHLPGEPVSYRITLRNEGSSAAGGVACRLAFPPQLEPADQKEAGFRSDGTTALRLEGVTLVPGGQTEFTALFRVRGDAPAGQELVISAELTSAALGTGMTFVSSGVLVQPRHGLLVNTPSSPVITIPGQRVIVPLLVSNTGNMRESFSSSSSLSGAVRVELYRDLNRDGVRQPGEPAVTEIGPLAPREEAALLAEITTDGLTSDGSTGTVQLAFRSAGDATRSLAAGTIRLAYTRPLVQLALDGRGGRVRPGEVVPYDLTVVNRGSDLARSVEVKSSLPAQLELVAAEPAGAPGTDGILWRLAELGAGEQKTIRLYVRVKGGTGVGSSLRIAASVAYDDRLGSRY